MAGSSGLTFELKGQQFIIKHNYSVKKPKAKKKKKKCKANKRAPNCVYIS